MTSNELRKRAPKTPRDPNAYFINATQVGRILGVRESDAMQLMESGVIHSYLHRTMIKTTRADVARFISGLRAGTIDVPGLLILHDNTKARLDAQNAATKKSH